MANTPKKKEDVTYVDITIPRIDKNQPNLIVGFNGKNYVLPRGKTSRVPDYVAAEIKRSWAAQEKLDAYIDETLENQSGWAPNPNRQG